jgi:hypothetical protein
MLTNRRLARAISDAAFGELRRQLTYKATWYDTELIVANLWFPSSKTCSGCGNVKADLTLSVRTYGCGRCGLVIDRDVNAAVNLAPLQATITEANAANSGRLTPATRLHPDEPGKSRPPPRTTKRPRVGTSATPAQRVRRGWKATKNHHSVSSGGQGKLVSPGERTRSVG